VTQSLFDDVSYLLLSERLSTTFSSPPMIAGVFNVVYVDDACDGRPR